ncbi:Cu(I)-responsive transcriptional regulator [Acuticoccus sediminis]|uniref:Cu(I)-responsive transcriptional regulator n=1 Tax=Acuticoccus sediminis TaxID=2184697 RepID=UPI001CFEB531|nr:Cu(I)-responsive transcriptional regulator [Acuticoccus sediminis]
MNIGDAAAHSGVPAKTIRYYEDIGLVRPQRLTNGYRDFGEGELAALAFIGRARSLGFSVEDCRTLLTLERNDHRHSHDVKAVAEGHLTRIEAKIAELQAMRATLEALVVRCHGDDRPDCPIMDDLRGACPAE